MDAKKTDETKASKRIEIKPARFEVVALEIEGDAPYVQKRFPPETRDGIAAKQAEGRVGKKRKARDPKDFERLYEQSKHTSTEGWGGIPAPALRSAMIRACKLCDITMADAKMCVFILADGYSDEGTPLVRITKGKAEPFDAYVRISMSTTDVTRRPMYVPGWRAKVRVKYDADMFSPADVANLLQRAGQQVGIGEGRIYSRNSDGCGWGSFNVQAGA